MFFLGPEYPPSKDSERPFYLESRYLNIFMNDPREAIVKGRAFLTWLSLVISPTKLSYGGPFTAKILLLSWFLFLIFLSQRAIPITLSLQIDGMLKFIITYVQSYPSSELLA